MDSLRRPLVLGEHQSMLGKPINGHQKHEHSQCGHCLFLQGQSLKTCLDTVTMTHLESGDATAATTGGERLINT